MLVRLVKLFTSLKLTVVLLALGIILIFWGTLAQVHLGLYQAQNDFFRSFFVYWTPQGSGLRIPIFPGGYLVGSLLIINLFAAHFRYYQPGKKKWGIVLIHFGILFLLIGQLLTDVLSVESQMHIRNGGTSNYSEAYRSYELAIVDVTDPNLDKVVAIPVRLLRKGEVSHPEMPFKVRAKTYYANSSIIQEAAAGYQPLETTAGVGSGIWWRELPPETAMNRQDAPSGVVELLGSQGSLGTYLVSDFLKRPQEFSFDGRRYQLDLRPERFYKPFSLHLIEFKHDKYAGTDKPKNYSSRVRVQRTDTGEDREVLIYMNSPLRYSGETYYQSGFDPDDQGTRLQVVRNPGWLTPYVACILVAAGMIEQFLSHLLKFAARRKTA